MQELKRQNAQEKRKQNFRGREHSFRLKNGEKLKKDKKR